MIKYYCDICDTELEDNNIKVRSLDFTGRIVHLCNSCYPKFKEAKESIFAEYKTRYDELNADYLDDLKDEILNDVDPEPVWEEPSDPPTEPEPTDPETVWE